MKAKQGSLRLAQMLSCWGAPALLVALPLMWLWRLVFAGQVLYWGIPLQQFYPWRLLVVESWLAGLPPLWNSWLGAGTPLLANHQSAPLYPPSFIFFLFPVERAIGYSVLLHLVLAGLAMYAYAGRLGLTKGGRVLAALAFAFGGYIVARVNFLTMICAIAWLPLAMWAGDLLGRKPTLRRALVLAAVLALQFLAGHIQLWYYTLWLVGAYVLYQAWASPEGTEGLRERWRGVARAGLLFIAAVALGVLLSAAQMLPTAELAQESQRQGGAAYEFAMTYSFWPWRLITLVVPDFFGNPGHGDYWGYGNYWEDAAYVGLLPLFLALYAGWRWLRSRGRGGTEGREGVMGVMPFFLAAVPVSILLALGKNFPLYPLVFRWVPGFGFFQAPARLLCWYAFAVAALAGIGWDLLRRSPRLERVARLLCVVAVGVMVAALAARLVLPDVQQTFSPALLRTGAPLAVGVSLLLMWRARLDRTGSRRWQLWQGAALGLVALDLFLFALPLIPTTDPTLYHRPTETSAFLSQDPEPFRTYTFARGDYQIRYRRYLLFGDFGPSDVDFLMGLRETLLPNLGLMEGIASAGNFDPLLVGRYERFMDAVNEVPLDVALRLLGLMKSGACLCECRHQRLRQLPRAAEGLGRTPCSRDLRPGGPVGSPSGGRPRSPFPGASGSTGAPFGGSVPLAIVGRTCLAISPVWRYNRPHAGRARLPLQLSVSGYPPGGRASPRGIALPPSFFSGWGCHQPGGVGRVRGCGRVGLAPAAEAAWLKSRVRHLCAR